MGNLKIFDNSEFGQIRTAIIESEPYFSGKDIADILGYTNPQKAIRDHVDDEDKTLNESFTVNGTMGVLINESGLYSLTLSSKLPTAKKFKRWVTSEVLPSLRSNGGYIVGQDHMTPEQIMAAGLKAAESIIQQKDKEIERMRPKEVFADAVAASPKSILIGELAKMIKQNGIDIGEKRLFAWLRNNGYLIKGGRSDYNAPTQKSANMGLIETKETVIVDGKGISHVRPTPKVTTKGQQYFINKFLTYKQEVM